jgi:hypothetical protein
VGAYLALMHDRYPSTDEKQYVTLELPYPDAGRELNRWLPPRQVAARHPSLCRAPVPLAGRPVTRHRGVVRDPVHRPLPARDVRLIESVLRWTNRVEAFVLLLASGRYPPFRLSP